MAVRDGLIRAFFNFFLIKNMPTQRKMALRTEFSKPLCLQSEDYGKCHSPFLILRTRIRSRLRLGRLGRLYGKIKTFSICHVVKMRLATWEMIWLLYYPVAWFYSITGYIIKYNNWPVAYPISITRHITKHNKSPVIEAF